ncbi:Transmembrane protein 65, putative [Angomonas deanei]|uniref:Transmembrane protein 65, putative n=1 Tax=Angomonas deanei TaxID=59799 RepID=A0A7G2CB95_9TRYP|nr:Transmembrane protein 65, putative [Angomonas deanei]
MRGSKQVGEVGGTSTSAPPQTAVQQPSSTGGPTDSEKPDEWIRNRRPKFWHIVYHEDEKGNVSTKPQKKDSKVSAASSAPEVPTSSSSKAGNESPKAPSAENTQIQGAGFHRNKKKLKVVQGLCNLLSVDGTLSPVLLQMLSPESRRLFLIMGTATEYFGEKEKGTVMEEIRRADIDKDFSISSAEYDAWAKNSISRKRTKRKQSDPQEKTKETPLPQPTKTGDPSLPIDETLHVLETPAPTPPPGNEKATKGEYRSAAQRRESMADAALNSLRVRYESTNPPTDRKRDPLVENFIHILKDSNYLGKKDNVDAKEEKTRFPVKIILQVFLTSAAPFFAFGLLDNTTFVIAGDQFDSLLQTKFNFNNAMVAAGFGGVMSGVIGIQVHGLAERWTRKLAPEIELTPNQRRSPKYFQAVRRGNTFGMMVGLTCGLLPLLFINAHKEEEDQEIIETEERKLVVEAHRIKIEDTVKKESKTRQYTVFEEAETRKAILAQYKQELAELSAKKTS